MALSSRDEQALRRLEQDLAADDPHLAARLRRPASPLTICGIVAMTLLALVMALTTLETPDGGAVGTLARTLLYLAGWYLYRCCALSQQPHRHQRWPR